MSAEILLDWEDERPAWTGLKVLFTRFSGRVWFGMKAAPNFDGNLCKPPLAQGGKETRWSNRTNCSEPPL